jgi:methionyl-tRNA formyltransferase
MGSPEFAVPVLRTLKGVVGVVTQPDRPSGRGRVLTPPPVKSLALGLGLPVIQPNKLREPEAMQQLRDWQPELIVVAAFGQILRAEVLDLPCHGCINVHASLLPRWRGAAPINACILHGDEETGVTIMKMDPGIDTGPTYTSRAVRIAPDETAATLATKLSQLGADLLAASLPGILDGSLPPQPQPAEGATYAAMIKKEDGLLDFNLPAVELERRVRAYVPWPGTYFLWKQEPLKVHRASPGRGSLRPGQRAVVDGLPAVGAGQGVLLLEEVQPPGKKPMPGRAFLAGARDWAE